MKIKNDKILSSLPFLFSAPLFALMTAYCVAQMLDGVWFMVISRRNSSLPMPVVACIWFGFTIYCGTGYTLYRDRIIMRLFGIPIWKFTWDQTCAAEYVAPKEKWQRPKVKFRIKPRNPGHPYRNLTVSIPERNADECIVALEECLGTIWMPKV